MERFKITVTGQLRECLLFAAVGVALGVWYELFRTRRLFGRVTAWQVFWQDIVAACGAACITLLASLPISSGRVRGVHLAVVALGALVYYVTVGRWFHGFLRRVVGWWRCFFCVACKKRKKIKENAKNSKKSFKNPLQPSGDM